MTTQFHLGDQLGDITTDVTRHGDATVITFTETGDTGRLSMVVTPHSAQSALAMAATLRAVALEHGAREDARVEQAATGGLVAGVPGEVVHPLTKEGA